MSEVLYKVLDVDGSAFHGGKGKWHLPQDGEPGEWMPPVEGELIPCKNGYHLCRTQDLLFWPGPAIYEAEARGDRIDRQDKVVVRQARLIRKLNWDERVAQLFACECAERVLHLFEREYPDDDRPRQAVEVTRQYVDGKVTEEELSDAWNAARTAVRNATRSAARNTARAAAWNAAGAAAGTAARNAARAAAGAAARNAVRAAARVAVWNATWDTAEATAWDDAWDAEQEWQIKRLIELISKE